jgi:hypothetical protein
VKRRSFLQWAAASLGALRSLCGLAWAQSSAALGPDGSATLGALADVVLPASLGPAWRAELVNGFERWLRGYREQAELDHGYGHTELRTSGPSPAPRYARQLEALETAARVEGKSFRELPRPRQQALVEAALVEAKLEDLPERLDGRHVAADLMTFFFRSADANDLCYRAAIGRDECRGLPGSEEKPKPLRERG